MRVRLLFGADSPLILIEALTLEATIFIWSRRSKIHGAGASFMYSTLAGFLYAAGAAYLFFHDFRFFFLSRFRTSTFKLSHFV